MSALWRGNLNLLKTYPIKREPLTSAMISIRSNKEPLRRRALSVGNETDG